MIVELDFEEAWETDLGKEHLILGYDTSPKILCLCICKFSYFHESHFYLLVALSLSSWVHYEVFGITIPHPRCSLNRQRYRITSVMLGTTFMFITHSCVDKIFHINSPIPPLIIWRLVYKFYDVSLEISSNLFFCLCWILIRIHIKIYYYELQNFYYFGQCIFL